MIKWIVFAPILFLVLNYKFKSVFIKIFVILLINHSDKKVLG